MLSACWMLSWELLARHRWLFRITFGYVVLVSLVWLVLPQQARVPQAAEPLMLILGCLAPLVLAVFCHGYDARLENALSGFPARLLTLPVPALLLAGTPLV